MFVQNGELLCMTVLVKLKGFSLCQKLHLCHYVAES